MILLTVLAGSLSLVFAQVVPPDSPPTAQLPNQNILFKARATSSDSLDPCQYMLQNLTTVETLAAHEVASLEQCLYYYLAGETAKRMRRFGIPHPIAAVPPNYVSKQPVVIDFHQLTLQHFELNEFLKDVAIHGYMEINWNDDRLKWSENTWKMQKLEIQSLSHVWSPVFIAQDFETALRNGDAFEMRKIETTSKGNVSATMAFSLRTFCDDSDFENFPDDVYKCCFTLEPHANSDVIEFTTSNLPIFTDPKYFRDYGWKLSGTVPQTSQDPAQVAQLGFCINLQRSSSSVRIELTVPLMVTSLIFLLSPFLGTIKTQIHIKLMVMGLQFLTFQLFSNRIAPHLGSAAATPLIMRFLEFAVVMNAISITVSVFMLSMTRIKRDLPPWGILTQVCNIINRVLCVLQSPSVEEEIDMEKQQISTNYHKDWLNAFIALHTMAMSLLTIVFLLGYIIIL